MSLDDFKKVIESVTLHQEVKFDMNARPHAIILAAADLLPVCKTLHEHPSIYFDMLSCITGIDNGVEANTMEIAYNIYSIPFNLHLMLKVMLPRENPVVESVSSIWKSADWLEREVFDMYGIIFNNHPDLRRILMPADWEGYPLRKDYKHQERYRNIKVEY